MSWTANCGTVSLGRAIGGGGGGAGACAGIGGGAGTGGSGAEKYQTISLVSTSTLSAYLVYGSPPHIWRAFVHN